MNNYGIRNEKTRRLVQLSLWSALTILLAFVPNIGYLTIGPFSITTVHIPVIIGAILLGPAAGAFLGLIFGVTSIIQATLQMPVTAFLFSPFVPFGNFGSVLIAIIPRVLIGVFAGLLYRFIKIKDKRGYIASLVAGIAGSLTNTVFVIGMAYLLFGHHYAQVTKKPFEHLLTILLSAVAVNSIFEAIVAAVVATAATKAILAAKRRTI